MVVGRLLSYWEGNFSGAMLNFGRVVGGFNQINITPKWESSLSRGEDQHVWNHQLDQTFSYDSDRVTQFGDFY